MQKLIDIILPNLNTPLHFLKERIKSIQDQTYQNWDCIVIDGFSENGSWEYLQEVAALDPRFKVHRREKRGIYNAWNEGIKLAGSKYIYIATSDDTMSSEFLKVMLETLTTHADCGIANCCLTIIDEQGNPIPGNQWDNYPSPKYFGSLIREKHIRHAPHDGILHAFVKTVYQSITQLVIRRDVFESVGYFREDSGSIADYEWGMRASLLCNVIHVPKYLATWRIHTAQATSNEIQFEPRTYTQLIRWVEEGLSLLKEEHPGLAERHSLLALTAVYRKNRRYYRLMKLLRNSYLLRIYRRFFRSHLVYREGITEARAYFIEKNLTALITTLP